MTVLNKLKRGSLCEVTTRDHGVISGLFLGIEVAHGECNALIQSGRGTHSIPVECIRTVGEPSRKVA